MQVEPSGVIYAAELRAIEILPGFRQHQQPFHSLNLAYPRPYDPLNEPRRQRLIERKLDRPFGHRKRLQIRTKPGDNGSGREKAAMSRKACVPDQNLLSPEGGNSITDRLGRIGRHRRPDKFPHPLNLGPGSLRQGRVVLLNSVRNLSRICSSSLHVRNGKRRADPSPIVLMKC
jgi:hypothetical protein